MAIQRYDGGGGHQSLAGPLVSTRPHGRVALEVTAGDTTVVGEVHRSGLAYKTWIDGDAVGRPTTYEAAVSRMVLFLRARLPVAAPADWKVVVRCMRLSIVAEFGPEGLRGLSDEHRTECVQRVLSYCPWSTLSDAIEAGSQILMHCCRPASAAS